MGMVRPNFFTMPLHFIEFLEFDLFLETLAHFLFFAHHSLSTDNDQTTKNKLHFGSQVHCLHIKVNLVGRKK